MHFVTSAKEVMISSALGSGITESYSTDFKKKLGEKATRPRKKPLDFGVNPDRVTLRSGLG